MAKKKIIDNEPVDTPVENCIIVGCKSGARWRGLCGRCYYQAKKMIESGRVSGWGQLADMGLAIDEPSPFTAVFESIISENAEKK